MALQLALQQRDGVADHSVQIAGLVLRLAPGQELADSLHDAPGLRGLLAEPLERAEHDRIGRSAALQRVGDAGRVACDRHQRLIQLVSQCRRDLAEHRQACMVRHRLGLMALALLEPLACGDVDDRAHPADLHAIGVDQRRLEHHHVEHLAVAVPPARLVAFARRVAGEVAAHPRGRFVDGVGRPVRHRRCAADQLVAAITHHIAEGPVDVEQAAFGVARTQPDERRVLHRAAPRGLAAPRCFGARDLLHLPPQQRSRGDDQHQKAADQHEGQGVQSRRVELALCQLQVDVAERAAEADPVAVALGARHAVAGRSDDLVERVDELHVVLACQPPRHAALEQHGRRVARDDHADRRARRPGADRRGDVHRQSRLVVSQCSAGAAGRHRVRHMGDDAVARVEPGHAHPDAAQPGNDLGLGIERVGRWAHVAQLRRKRVDPQRLFVELRPQLGFETQRVGNHRLAQFLALVAVVALRPDDDAEHEQHRQRERCGPQRTPHRGRRAPRRLRSPHRRCDSAGRGHGAGHARSLELANSGNTPYHQ